MSISYQILSLFSLLFGCGLMYAMIEEDIEKEIKPNDSFQKFKVISLILSPIVLTFLSYFISEESSVIQSFITLLILILLTGIVIKKMILVNNINEIKYLKLVSIYLGAYVKILVIVIVYGVVMRLYG